MKVTNVTQRTEKRTYSIPVIEKILLDNEISLILQSAEGDTPPDDPTGFAPDRINSDPYKANLG